MNIPMKHFLMLLLLTCTLDAQMFASEFNKRYGENFYPPPGKILHMAGQTREGFADYVEHVTEDGKQCDLPAGVAFYSSLYRTGFKTPHANLPGDDHQDLSNVLSRYEHLIPQISIWADEQELVQIALGQQDENIEKVAKLLISYQRPIYLRFAGECDDGRYKDPEAYKKAYRHVVDLFVAHGVKNVSYVWQSIGLKPTFQDRDPLDWYPGDAYVNWIGISFYQIDKEGYYPDHNRDRVLEIAREKKLPIMIVESSAIRKTAGQKKLTGQAYWNYWYKPYFEFIERNSEVRGFSIIDTNWDSQQQFKRFDWGDARLEEDPVVLEHWRNQLQDPRYLHSQENLYELLGYRAE